MGNLPKQNGGGGLRFVKMKSDWEKSWKERRVKPNEGKVLNYWDILMIYLWNKSMKTVVNHNGFTVGFKLN